MEDYCLAAEGVVYGKPSEAWSILGTWEQGVVVWNNGPFKVTWRELVSLFNFDGR